MTKKIGNRFTYQAFAPNYSGPIRSIVHIHAIDVENAKSYLEDLGYTNLVSVLQEKRGPKKVVTQLTVVN